MEKKDCMGKRREENFKIGCVHGEIFPKGHGNREDRIRNYLFLVGTLILKDKNIRLIAYEMPTKEKKGERIDLFGYDQNFEPHIIELKVDDTGDKILRIIKQISGYAEDFLNLKLGIEKEIKDKYHFDFKFSNNKINKVILAERDYYKDKQSEIKQYKDANLYFCSFARIRDIEKKLEKGIVNTESITLRVEN